MTNKVPNIRFKGFTDDWEQRKLGELVTFSKGSGYSKGDLLEEGTPIILYGRLYTKYETVISNVDTFVEPKEKSVFSKGGEVIVPGSGETAEDISIASVVEESGVLLGGDLNIITPPKEINSAFLAISISNGKPHKDMAKMAQGKSVVHLHNSDLAKIDFPFPIYEEQCRISNQFAELDNLITLHQRKCEQTKELKKFMLQKMFPKKGEKNPEIRFPGFTDDWEQRKLGEIADKVTKKNKDIVVDEVFTNSAEFGIISQRDFFDKEIANAENIGGYYIVEPNDFVYNPRISTTAPFGPIKRNKLERTGAMSPLYYVFRPHGIDLSYLEWYFQTTCWHAFMRVNGNSGARSDRFAITDKTFNKMLISVPQDIEEQRKVGTFLTELDHLITLHQRKCEQLKELKKFMLQNMFPKKG